MNTTVLFKHEKNGKIYVQHPYTLEIFEAEKINNDSLKPSFIIKHLIRDKGGIIYNDTTLPKDYFDFILYASPTGIPISNFTFSPKVTRYFTATTPPVTPPLPSPSATPPPPLKKVFIGVTTFNNFIGRYLNNKYSYTPQQIDALLILLEEKFRYTNFLPTIQGIIVNHFDYRKIPTEDDKKWAKEQIDILDTLLKEPTGGKKTRRHKKKTCTAKQKKRANKKKSRRLL